MFLLIYFLYSILYFIKFFKNSFVSNVEFSIF